MSVVYENENIRIEIEESEIPWLKIFTQYPYKEMSEVPAHIKLEIYDLLIRSILHLSGTMYRMYTGISWHVSRRTATFLNRCGGKSSGMPLVCH